jgi:hypothetical protein
MNFNPGFNLTASKPGCKPGKGKPKIKIQNPKSKEISMFNPQIAAVPKHWRSAAVSARPAGPAPPFPSDAGSGGGEVMGDVEGNNLRANNRKIGCDMGCGTDSLSTC